MPSGIGTFAAQELQLNNTLDVQERVERLQVQLSTGKKARTFDGISQDARRLLDLERSQTANKAFQQNVKQAKLRLKESANSINKLESIASRFQQQLVSANTDTNTEKLTIKNTAQNLRQELRGFLNKDLAGRHLFSGTETGQKSVSFEGKDLGDVAAGEHYQGNDESIETRATETLTIDGNVTADDATKTGIQELITATTRIIESDGGDALNGAIDAALDDLNGGSAQIATTSVDPEKTLDSTSPSFSSINFDITDTKTGTTKTVNVGSFNNTKDTIQDAVERLNDNANFSDLATARVENTQDGARVVIQSKSSHQLQISSNSGTPADDEFAEAMNFTQDPNRQGAIERLASTSADIGSRLQTLNETLSSLESENSQNETAIGDIENVNITKAATEMSSLQNTLRASFAATSRLQDLSILNFLR